MAMSKPMSKDHDRATLLSITAVAAMIVAYLLAFSVLSDTDMASKFENGVAPPGTDLVGIQTAAVASIVAALGAWAAALASKRTAPAVLVLAATAPFALLQPMTLGLAL